MEGRTPAEWIAAAREAFVSGAYVDTEARATAALDRCTETADDACWAEAMNLLGCVDLERGDYKRAAERFIAALDRFQLAGEAFGAARARSNLGLVHWRIHDLARAREDFEAVLPTFEAAGDPRAVGNTLNSLGLVADEEGDRGAAIALFRRALPLVESVGDAVFTANVLANLADSHEALGQWDAAWSEAERALTLRLAVGHRRGVVGSRVSIARLAVHRGDPDRAAAEIALGRALAREMGLKKHEADLVELSARVQAAQQNWRVAYELAGESCVLRQALQADELTHHVANLRAGLDVREARRVAEAQRLENEALREAKLAAEAASRAKSEFVAVVSHEIRTPLTTVVGATELLRDTTLDKRQRELVELASASSRALLGVVEDVLDISRIESGRLALASEDVDLDALLGQLRALLRQRAEAKRIQVLVERHPDAPTHGLGDFSRLRQVLVNLLVNAVKFTHEGAVTLRAWRDPAGVRFEVEDTGIGMAPEVLPTIFEAFVQADSSSTRRYGGAGLGLYIARQIVDAMKGTIAVRSTVGVGTTFTVVVPFGPSTPEPHLTPPSETEGLALPVLVVDDDPQVAAVITAMLEHIGCSVHHAAEATSAMAIARTAPWALVLVDVHMPVIDGYELTRMLRAEHGRGLPIYGLSGAATAEARERGLAAGMDGYLTKPTTLRALRTLLRTLSVTPAG